MALSKLKLLIRGLYTHPNTLSEVPEGALAVADNGVIDRESIFESRRGFKQYGAVLTDADKLFVFKDKLLAHDGAQFFYDSDDAGTFLSLAGSFAAPCPPTKIQKEEMNLNAFFTTDGGIYKMDQPTNALVRAGIQRAPDLFATVVGGGGFLPNNRTVAYRIVWGTYDANDNLILGAPSARAIAENTSGGNANVDLNMTVPENFTTNHFVQVYRSESVASGGTPSDEMQLVIEHYLTAGEITAGEVDLTDDIVDDFKGAFIYTSATREGALQENVLPPLACDLTEFKQHMFYANTMQPQQLIVTMGENVPLDETVTLAGVTYTQRAAEDIAADEFQLGADVTETMRSLIRVINRSASNTTVYAYEIADNQFFVETRSPAGGSFTLDASDPALFATPLIATSVGETKKNRVYISKQLQPEAVPRLNFLDCGSAEEPILRILSVRDAVFVLKSDGIWRITGTTVDNFIEEQHDTTVEILGAETAVEFDNEVYALSNKGLLAISVSGVREMSRPIDRTIRQIEQLSNFAEQAWAVGYDSDKKYILGLPSDDSDPNVKQLYVLNLQTASWTRWPIEMIAGVVNDRNDRLYMIRGSDDQIVEERKTFTLDDYADDEYSVTITAASGDIVTISSVPADVEVGMSLKQGVNEAVILGIDGNDLTVSIENLPWTLDVAGIFTPIFTILEWVEEHAGNPGVLKHFSEITFLFEDARFRTIDSKMSTNFLAGFKTTTLRAKGQGAWGLFPWGDVPWGGGLGGFQPLRTYFPKETTRAHWANIRLELNQAFTAFSCAGASVIHTVTSTRFR